MTSFFTFMSLEDGIAAGTMLIVKATVILLLALTGHWALRHAAAATRHFWWALSLVAVLALPLLSSALPIWQWQLPAAVRQPVVATVEPVTIAPDQTLKSGEAVPVALPAVWRAPSEIETVSVNANIWTWQLLAVAVWVCGVLLVLGSVVISWMAAWNLRQTAMFVTDYGWSVTLRHLSERLHLRAHVPLLLSDAVRTPLTCGVLRPAVMLPVESSAWPESWRSAVLLHELAHIKRRDCLTQLMAQLVCALFWFHPLVWWAARQLRIERELACDDAVLTMGTRASDYATYLVELARPLTRGYNVLAPAAVGIGSSHLESRVRAMLDPALPRTGLSRGRWMLAAVSCAVILLPLAALRLGTAQAAVLDDQSISIRVSQPQAPENLLLAADNELEQVAASQLIPQRPDEKQPSAEQDNIQALPVITPEIKEAVIELQEQQPNVNTNNNKSLTVDDLIQMKLFDVTPEFIEMLRRNGYENPSRQELRQLKIHGIDEAFIKEMRVLSGNALSLSELVHLRVTGITTDYVQQIKQTGVEGTLKQISQMRLHGVTKDYIAELRQLGYANLTANELSQLRIHGVTAAYIADLRKAGFADLTLEKVKSIRIHGLTPEYSAAMKAAGVSNATLDDLLKLRIHGVTTEFVQRMKTALNSKEISAKDLIRLKISGIDEMLQRK